MKWTVVAALLVACGSKTDDKSPPKAVAVEVTWAPRVATADVLAKWSDPPPPVIVLDARGNGLLSSVETWDALSIADPTVGAEPLTGTAMALLSPRTPATAPVTIADDGEDSPGTFAAVNLEEMPEKREPEPAAVVERKKLLAVAGGAKVDKRFEQPAAPMPIHKVIGEVMMDGTLQNPSALIVAAPTAKATTLVDLLAKTNAALGVVHDNKVRPLRIDFADRNDRPFLGHVWLELRVGMKRLAFEVVPDVPVPVEMATLPATLDQLRKERQIDPRTRVDVLVDDDVDVQRLVDALVALDRASVLVIGLGHTPATDSEQAKQRGARRPTIWFGEPLAHGDLDKALIREKVRGEHAAFAACHATKSALSGTVQTQFFIAPTGRVVASNAQGVDPEVSSCVAKIIKALVFPKPSGGGGVQVNYPLTFRP